MNFSFFAEKMLTNEGRYGIIIDVPCDAADAHQLHGEMSEWFKELVLKTSDPARDRGFESHSLRHILIEQFERTFPWSCTQVGDEAPLLRE